MFALSYQRVDNYNHFKIHNANQQSNGNIVINYYIKERHYHMKFVEFSLPSTSLCKCIWCPIGTLIMTPSGNSQQNSLQLWVTTSTETTLQSHNLDSVDERKGNKQSFHLNKDRIYRCQGATDTPTEPKNPIGRISVYKHCFCYSNVPTTGTKDPLFRQAMKLWLAP